MRCRNCSTNCVLNKGARMTFDGLRAGSTPARYECATQNPRDAGGRAAARKTGRARSRCADRRRADRDPAPHRACRERMRLRWRANCSKEYGSLGGLSRCTVKEIGEIHGIGPAKATQLVAAFGLGQRLARESFARQKIETPELVYDLLGPEMRTLHKESLRVILLDTRYHLSGWKRVSFGSVNESIAHPRDVFRPAVISFGLRGHRGAQPSFRRSFAQPGGSQPNETFARSRRTSADQACSITSSSARRPRGGCPTSVSRKRACCENSSDRDRRSESRNSATASRSAHLRCIGARGGNRSAHRRPIARRDRGRGADWARIT